MRKLILMAASLAAVVALTVPAQAATGSDTATLSVTVLSTITVNFTDDTANFGSSNSGLTLTDNDTLSYDVATNNAAGFTLEARTTDVGHAQVTFALGGAGGANNAYQDLPINSGSAIGTSPWRTQNAAGSFTYQDDVRVVIGVTAPAASYSRVVNYIATTA